MAYLLRGNREEGGGVASASRQPTPEQATEILCRLTHRGAAGADELGTEDDARLPPTPPVEQVLTDYQTTRLSLKGHPMAFLRPAFARSVTP